MNANKITQSIVRLIYPHQLFEDNFNADKTTVFILIEDDLFFRQFPFHKQKLMLHHTSMTLFKDSLKAKGFKTCYIETSSTSKSMDTLQVLLKKMNVTEVSYYDLVDNLLEKHLTKILSSVSIKPNVLVSPGFLTTRGQLEEYFDTYPNRMQNFYEWQRKRLNILVDGNKPVGGKWSFDHSNRKKLPKNVQLPPTYATNSSEHTQEAIDWVETHFKDNPGSSAKFKYPVSHSGAKKWLSAFLSERLDTFGPYEDAISSTETEIFHSILSPLINTGLLTPAEVIGAAVSYKPDTIPIESLEGFVRQIIGWREYMRATYLKYGSKMRTSNYLNAHKKLPKSWWDGTVGIYPVDTVIKNVLETGYAHHIERLMILGNSMVLLRIDPDDMYEWFMSLFVDAYDWVMVPNVYAMSSFAAGELITTKPYISGSNYIIKMSNYKKDDWSVIWDALYWQFIHDHRSIIEKNYRSAMVAKLYDRFDDDKKELFKKIADEWIV